VDIRPSSIKTRHAMFSFMSRKSRGIAAERDLVHLFWAAKWAAMRAPASGSTKYPCPDVIAGNNVRKVAIEAKLTTDKAKYFTKQEVEELILFAENFGAEPWLAVKFPRQPWYFFTPESAVETNKSYVVSLERAKSLGIEFDDLIK